MKNVHEKFMRLAIRQAKIAKNRNAAPIGAVIVKDSKVIARSYNKKDILHDATAHAEILAIRMASKIVGSNLDGCTIYTTLHPCLMCLGACYWAHIEDIWCGVDIEGGTKYYVSPYDTNSRLIRSMYKRKINIHKDLLHDDCYALYI